MNRLPPRRLLSGLFAPGPFWLVLPVPGDRVRLAGRAIRAPRGRAGWLALAGLSLLFYFGVRAARWMVMIRTVCRSIRFAGLYVITAASIALSNMTPGQAGEALKVEWLHRLRWSAGSRATGRSRSSGSLT